MPLFTYTAFTKEGKKVQGSLDVSSVEQAKAQLTRQGLYVISVSATESKGSFFERIFARNVKTKEKILFTRQLAILLKSGVPLLQAIELLTDQFQGRLRSMLISIKDDVKAGSSLADAMNKYPKVFDTIYVQLVKAGEATGKLESILERLVYYMERQEAIRKRIRGALQYPMIQLVISLAVVAILLTTVVPQLQAVFSAQGKELPWSTRFMVATSNMLKNHYFILLGIIIGVVWAFRTWKRSASGSRMWDKIKLKIPLVSYITRTSALVQFSYTFGILLEGGVNLAQALDIVVKIIDNKVLADALNEARDKIIKQGRIAQYLGQTNMFPPIAVYLIRTGEESGQLDTMLLTVARNYEDDLSELIDRLTGLLNPIMLVVMALIVGFIIMAIAGPIMRMSQEFQA